MNIKFLVFIIGSVNCSSVNCNLRNCTVCRQIVTWLNPDKKAIKEKCAEMLDTCCPKYVSGFEGLTPVQNSQDKYTGDAMTVQLNKLTAWQTVGVIGGMLVFALGFVVLENIYQKIGQPTPVKKQITNKSSSVEHCHPPMSTPLK